MSAQTDWDQFDEEQLNDFEPVETRPTARSGNARGASNAVQQQKRTTVRSQSPGRTQSATTAPRTQSPGRNATASRATAATGNQARATTAQTQRRSNSPARTRRPGSERVQTPIVDFDSETYRNAAREKLPIYGGFDTRTRTPPYRSSGARITIPPFTVNDENIVALVTAMKSSDCGDVPEQDVVDFLTTVKRYNIPTRVLVSVMNTLSRVNPNYRPTGTVWRSGNQGVEQRTLGRRGTGQEGVEKPSLLWKVAIDNCRQLPQLSRDIKTALDNGNLGDVYQSARGSTEIKEVERDFPVEARAYSELVHFLEANQHCENNLDSILRLLLLIDQYQWNSTAVNALLNFLSVEGFLMPPWKNGQNYRGARNAITAATLGQTLNTKDIVKASLLWVFLGEYCQQLDPIIDELGKLLSQIPVVKEVDQKAILDAVKGLRPTGNSPQ